MWRLMDLSSCRLWLLSHRKGLLLKVTAKFGMTSAVFSFGIELHASRTNAQYVCMCPRGGGGGRDN